MNARIALALLGLSLPLTGMADIYRWTDANGQLHFGQTPPAQGHYERVRPADTSSGMSSNLGQFVEQSDKTDAEAEKARQSEVKAKAERAERCAKARERLSLLEQKGPHRMFMPGAKAGDDPSRMTDEQFQQRLDEARQAEAENCR